MTQIVLKPNIEVYTMSPQNFLNTYQDISSTSSYKSSRQCDYGYRQSGFQRNRSLETLRFQINVSPVQVYPNGAHNPPATYLCITKDGSIKFMRLRKTDRDPDTNKNVDMFVKDEDLKDFYMNKIEKLLINYEPGRPDMKPDVLQQMVNIERDRRRYAENMGKISIKRNCWKRCIGNYRKKYK